MTDTTKAMTVVDMVSAPAFKKQVAMALPNVGISADKMVRVMLTAMRQTPKLAQCQPASLMASIMQASQLGLTVNDGQGLAYLIPYGSEATFVLGYRGMLALAHRSDQIQSISSHVVYEKDNFVYEFGADEKMRHVPCEDVDRGNPTGVWAVVKTTNGGTYMDYMSAARLKQHQDAYSKVKKDSPWDDPLAFEWMWRKTILKQVLKLAPTSTELTAALGADDRAQLGFSPEIDVTPPAGDAAPEQTRSEHAKAAAKAAAGTKSGDQPELA